MSCRFTKPGLSEIVSECRGRNLTFTTAVDESIRGADMIFISVNTPTKTFGVGAGRAANLEFIEKCARKIAEVSEGHKIVVGKIDPAGAYGRSGQDDLGQHEQRGFL